MTTPTLQPLDRAGLSWAQATVAAHHYLHTPVDPRCSVEGYSVHLPQVEIPVGLLLFGRPQATKYRPWYGSVEEVRTGRVEVTRWQVLNLARVWFDPQVQPGGRSHSAFDLPGYTDRRGIFRSTLASTAICLAAQRVRVDYLVARPPIWLDQPYQLRYLLSYCNRELHRGTIYRAAGFTRYSINHQGIETWRLALPPLTEAEDAAVRRASARSPRAQRYRAVQRVARQKEFEW